MTRESGQSTEAGTPENSVVEEVPPPTVRLQISAAKKLNLAAFQNAVYASVHESVHGIHPGVRRNRKCDRPPKLSSSLTTSGVWPNRGVVKPFDNSCSRTLHAGRPNG